MNMPDDIQKAARAVALVLCNSSESMEAIVARALLAERERATAWQPIETAPKDGTEVLLFFPLDGLDLRVWPQRIIAEYRHGLWVWQGRAVRGYSESYQPTHWMPLPQEPRP